MRETARSTTRRVSRTSKRLTATDTWANYDTTTQGSREIKTLVSDLKALLSLAADQDFSKGPLSVEIKRPGKKRSLSANGLYHMWLKQLADHFSKTAGPYCSDEMHDLMKHQFLGYEDRVINKTVIHAQLRSTANLDTPEFSEYMAKIEAWAADHGCLVTIPAHSQYAEWLTGKR